MTTALQLVNRVRRELRWGDTSVFTDDLSKVVLDCVNGAQATLFESFDWECDKRHDGVLLTFSQQTKTSGTAIKLTYDSVDTQLLTWSGAIDLISTNGWVTASVRARITDHATWPDTSLRALAANYDYAGAIKMGVFDAPLWGNSGGSYTVEFCANEYLLPVTVRKVYAARHQETPVRVEMVGRTEQIDRFVQQPHRTVSDNPEVIYVGAQVTRTIDWANESSDTTPPVTTTNRITGTGMLIYPTPLSEYLLNYSYLLQRSDLAAATDTISPCDRSLEDLLVQLAVARLIQSNAGEADPTAGLAMEERVMRKAARLHANMGRDPGRHRIIGSNFAGSTTNEFGRLPINYGSLTNQ